MFSSTIFSTSFITFENSKFVTKKKTQISKIFFILITLNFLVACGGGSFEEMAQNALYPYEDVNKAYAVPETPPAGYNNVTFELTDTDGMNYSVHGWYFRNANPRANTIVYFHGNGENLQSMAASNFLKRMEQLNTNIVAIDYPRYGRSTGTPTEFSLVSSARAAIQFAAEEFSDGKVYVWGRSIGASVATLAYSYEQSNSQVASLILTSPWTDFYAVALELSSLAKQIPKPWLAKNTYNSVAAATTIDKPVLIHHGAKDKIVPIKFGRIVAQSFVRPELVSWLEFAAREHNDIFLESQLWNSVEQYVK
jgi:alpha-beta hydrolase superfamily lysophospholipase